MAGSVTVVGLGPGDPTTRTVGVQRALDAADRIILRTGVHPGLDDLLADPRVSTCDDLYESAESFDNVYEAIVERVCEAAQDDRVVFAVPGHPFCGERTVTAILLRLEPTGTSVEVLNAVSALDAVASTLRRDLLADQAQIVDAAELVLAVEAEPFAGGLLDLAPAKPCIVMQVYSSRVASAVKHALARVFPDEHEVTVITGAGVPGVESVTYCRLFEVDHRPVNHLTSIWVPPLAALDAHRSATSLHRITARLRSPNGCPWDRDQTHRSLRNAVIEEAFEVVDAIDDGDVDALAEELGDLLLMVFLHAQIAEEHRAFTLEDVYEQIIRKLIRRHPHVFGDIEAPTPGAVIKTWENVKAEERRLKNDGNVPLERHPLDKLPRSMPALQRIASLLDTQLAVSDQTRLNESERERLGEALFASVEALVRARLDPETELERVARSLIEGKSLPRVQGA